MHDVESPYPEEAALSLPKLCLISGFGTPHFRFHSIVGARLVTLYRFLGIVHVKFNRLYRSLCHRYIHWHAMNADLESFAPPNQAKSQELPGTDVPDRPPQKKTPWTAFLSFIWDSDSHLKSPEERRLLFKLDCAMLSCLCLGEGRHHMLEADRQVSSANTWIRPTSPTPTILA